MTAENIQIVLSQAQSSASHILELSNRVFTNEVDFQELIAVLVANQDSLPRKLDLNASKFRSKKEFGVLLKIIAECHGIQELDVSTNHLCTQVLDNDGSLTTLLRSKSLALRRLDLTGHALTTGIVQDLVRGLQQQQGNNKKTNALQELILHNCSLTQEAAALVLQHAQHFTLLDLGGNQTLTPAFLNEHVAPFVSNNECKNKLQTLILSHSPSMFAVQQDAHDLEPFWQAFRSPTCTLTELSLRCCNLKQDVGKALLETLTVNATLLYLDLEFSGFGLRDQGSQIVLDILPKLKALQVLKMLLRYPPAMVPALVAAVQENSTLRYFLPLVSNNPKAAAQIKACLARNLCLDQAKTILRPQAVVPAALLPAAVAHLEQTPAATYKVLSYWMAVKCLEH